MRNIVILLLVLFLTSCEEWFDVSPKSDIKAEDLFSTQKGFEDALFGVYSLMTLPASYGANLTFGYTDVLARYYKVGSKSHFNYAYKYTFDEKSEEARLSIIWSTTYKAIANLNGILEYIDDRQGVFSENNYYLYKGEALALRALLHFDMLRLFSPSVAVGEDREAIPYMNVYTHVAQQRLNVKKVLEFVIKDLETARELMKPYDSFGPNYKNDDVDDTPEGVRYFKSRMRYYSATALLARVYLYAGNNAKALLAAQEIIGEPQGEIVPIFQMVSRSQVSDPLFEDEVIFRLSKKNLKEEADLYFGDVAAASVNNTDSKYLRMDLNSKNKIYSTSNPMDVEYRESWFKTAGTDSKYVTLSKYLSVEQICLLRVSELFLIAAECSENESDKLEYLNRFRAHRGLAPLSEVGDAIHEEYRKEFVGEGQLFFFYKRKNMNKIGVDNKSIDVEKVYSIPLPVSEQELG